MTVTHSLLPWQPAEEGERGSEREVRCLCFNGRDIYTQSHMHRHLSARVSLPRFTLEDTCLHVPKKHTAVTEACLRGSPRENSSSFLFFVQMSKWYELMHNLNSLEDLTRSKDGKEADFKQEHLPLWARIPRGQKHHSPTSFEGWKG